MAITFDLQPKQSLLVEAALNGPATTIGYGGSRGGAKSHGLRCALLAVATRYPGAHVALMRRTWPQLRDNHIDKYRMMIPDTFRRGWHAQERELWLGSSRIGFRYAESEADVLSMIGKEYQVIAVDQAEMFSEREILTIRSCCRRPGFDARLILSFNPGGIGHAFLKRIFWDHQYRQGERPGEYQFIQAFGWDNVEWARPALASDGLTPDDYYGWTERQRYEYFTTRTDYGRQLNALPAALRLGWLLGLMDQFAGQYFDCFDPERHVGRRHVEPWRERWIGIDWGFGHPSAAYWLTNLDGVFHAYREFSGAGRSPSALAAEIVDRTAADERGMVRQIWLSHDAFSQRDEREPIARQMGRVFTAAGMPFPRQSTRDVVSSSTAMYDLIRDGKVLVDPSCGELLRALPMVSRDQDRPEHPLKFEGDDPFDAFRYALYGRGATTVEEVTARIRADIAKQETDPLRRWQRLTKIARPGVGGAVPANYRMPWE